MSTLLIFILGVFVTSLVGIAVVLIGVGEVTDPAHGHPDDLARWERKLVGGTHEASDDET